MAGSTSIYNKVITPCGSIFIADRGGELCLCDWHEPKIGGPGTSPLLEEAKRRIDMYFKGKLKEFGLPFQQEGTPFRKLVWEGISSIPYGTTISYRELAKMIGRPDAVRAVASACGDNKLSLIVPCHRVVGSDGKLRGYAGGLRAKATLLELERDHIGM